ncbi:Bgt-3395 [Blumeria graminis f. sp. tritici]|uniref:Bgt-3395 n=2 Tax=Blumeria graminis f. sp. tritici TaxID=62690 RepID=A0A9X9MHF7_BLUGR|nr:hypothetical protein BGT96224_3395 [Blumeria graminis f. sp. tritici 96224]VDB88121.1 Bgt-3395 [Blumeria graminis f. sp. tritici]
MDFTIENHAPITERGSCSFSIPSNTPPIFLSATPPSQPILPQHDVVVTDRPTLQPVPPSKHENPKSCHDTTAENVNDANEFLPRKLAQIIEERQRRELAWHACIMMCTCAISSIESALSGFMKDIEKDEATATRDYLCKAISKYAASEAAPLLLPFPRSVDQFLTGHKARIKIKRIRLALQRQLQQLDPLRNFPNCLASR